MEDKQKQNRFLADIQGAQGMINKVCQMYCREVTDQQDLRQEMLIQLWRSYDSFQGKAKFSTWLYRVCLNVALRYSAQSQRRQQQQARYTPSTPASPEINFPEQDEEQRALYQAIEHLSEVEKAITFLFLAEHSQQEIAEIMGITTNYVRVRMNRIRAKLKQRLNA